jgi:type VI secretion system protein ImpI
MVALPPHFREAQATPLHPLELPNTHGGIVPAQRVLEQTALKGMDGLSRKFLGHPQGSGEDLAFFTARIEEVLDVFLRCFLALQKGQQQFQRTMDIKVLGAGDDNLGRATTTAELAAALFALADGDATRRLENYFKNIMIHQVALLNGLMAGVRSLLAKLSPKAITKEAGKSHRLSGVRALWETYERIHGDLAEEDDETFETIFGPQFAKAYSDLVGDKG